VKKDLINNSCSGVRTGSEGPFGGLRALPAWRAFSYYEVRPSILFCLSTECWIRMCCLFREVDGWYEIIFLNGHLQGDQVVYGMGYRYIFVSCSHCSGYVGYLSFIDLLLLQMKILGSSRLVSTVHFSHHRFLGRFFKTFFPVLWIRIGFSADPDSIRT
jgi:hypothetical protein